MMMSIKPVVRREVVAMRVRVNWRGALVLQVRNRLERVRLIGAPEDAGLSTWRDADARNPSELAQVILLLRPNA